MRILIWASSYPPGVGGVEVVVHDLVRGLIARGHEALVVTQGDSASESSATTEDDVTVHRLPFHQVLSSRDPARVAVLTDEVAGIRRDFAPDVVHAHAVHPSLFFLLRTTDAAPCPLVFTIHGWTELAAGEGTLRDRMLHRADWVTGCSQSIVDRAILEMPGIADRTSTIYNGCRDSGMTLAPLPFDPPQIVFVGRLVETKGVDRVLQAMPGVLAAFPAARLTIVGDGPLRPALAAEAARLRITGQTTFTGAVERDRVFGYVNASTLLVAPSRGGTEGLTLVALEAALMQRPVVATRDGGLAEAVVDGETGFLVQDDDPASLTRSILRILTDRDLAVRLGRAGRQRVMEQFDWETQVDRYMSLYERAAGGRFP